MTETAIPRNKALAAFLRDRRGRVEPSHLGLPHTSGRRVPGLRREEVAHVAGVSVDYYARLEQGRQRSASPSVLNSVARTLRLTKDERRHLFDLARVPDEPPAAEPDGVAEQRVRRLLIALGDNPAMVIGRFVDIVDANPAASFVFADFAAMPSAERNGVRWMLLSERARELYGDGWESAAAELVGMLRLDAGQYPEDPRLGEITAELVEHSPLFRRLWRDQTVSTWQHHQKLLRHPEVGEIELTNEFLTVHGAAQLRVIVMIPTDSGALSLALAARP
ncbi:helix-turn-helix transcriptional regulator [Micromonospora azadirachtae]|uniref:Helix-turn-helix transcriptional regulator n=1 Tax=Micromonospora azadirachtae TaxID=1970735 RepID=A0ABW2ZX47_9ACTN